MARGAYVQFEETTSDLSDNAFRVLVYLRHHAVKSGIAYPSIEGMSEDLKRSTRTCKRAIAELKLAGFVTVRLGKNGVWEYVVRHPESDPKTTRRGDKFVTDIVTNLSPTGDDASDTTSDTTSDKFVIPPKNPHIGELTERIERIESSSVLEESKPAEKATTTTTQNLEPFEAGIGTELPSVRNAVEPFRPRLVELQPTKFRTETRDRIMAVLGHDGEQFARKITQEQADAGFADWILDESAKNKTPARLAFHLLKTAWHPGWVSPRAAKEAKREALRKRLEALR